MNLAPTGRFTEGTMPQSLSNILVHIIFSTKNRNKLITAEIESELQAYLVSICRSHDSASLKIGGIEDHVHILCKLSRTITIADLVQKIKTGSSKWIKTKGSLYSRFSWQSGYGAFSIGNSNLWASIKYIGDDQIYRSTEKTSPTQIIQR